MYYELKFRVFDIRNAILTLLLGFARDRVLLILIYSL